MSRPSAATRQEGAQRAYDSQRERDEAVLRSFLPSLEAAGAIGWDFEAQDHPDPLALIAAAAQELAAWFRVSERDIPAASHVERWQRWCSAHLAGAPPAALGIVAYEVERLGDGWRAARSRRWPASPFADTAEHARWERAVEEAGPRGADEERDAWLDRVCAAAGHRAGPGPRRMPKLWRFDRPPQWWERAEEGAR